VVQRDAKNSNPRCNFEVVHGTSKVEKLGFLRERRQFSPRFSPTESDNDSCLPPFESPTCPLSNAARTNLPFCTVREIEVFKFGHVTASISADLFTIWNIQLNLYFWPKLSTLQLSNHGSFAFAAKDNCLSVFGEYGIKLALVGQKLFNTDEKYRKFSSLRDFNETHLLMQIAMLNRMVVLLQRCVAPFGRYGESKF